MSGAPELYDLCAVAGKSGKGKGGESDSCAIECVTSFLKGLNVNVKGGIEVELFKELLTPILTTTKVKPDVYVFSERKFPLLLCEVHSSPYSCTIIKCITLVTDLVRLHRLHGKDVTCTGFIFPKFGSKTCVAKVDVKWEQSKFCYNLQFLHDPTCVQSQIVDTVQKAIEVGPGALSVPTLCMGVINLLPEELAEFGVTQIKSRTSILLKSETHIYKYPIGSRGIVALFMASTLLRLEHAIVLSPVLLRERIFFLYEKVPHDPLSISEAAVCLFSFVKEVAKAIEALHQRGFAHQDLRLENICFSKENEPVLIDLDWMCTVHHKPEFFNNSMYKVDFSAEQNDWLQLGLIISWVTHDHGHIDYYNPQRQHVPKKYAHDRFLCALIDGKYVEHLQDSNVLFTYNKTSLKDVLTKRNI